METIKIYRFQLEAIQDALRLTDNIYNCSKKDTSYKRDVMQAKKYAENALNNKIDDLVIRD